MTIQWTQMNSAPLSTRSAPEAVAKEVKIKKFPDSSKTAYHQTLIKGQSLDPHDPPTPMFSHESMGPPIASWLQAQLCDFKRKTTVNSELAHILSNRRCRNSSWVHLLSCPLIPLAACWYITAGDFLISFSTAMRRPKSNLRISYSTRRGCLALHLIGNEESIWEHPAPLIPAPFTIWSTVISRD